MEPTSSSFAFDESYADGIGPDGLITYLEVVEMTDEGSLDAELLLQANGGGLSTAEPDELHIEGFVEHGGGEERVARTLTKVVGVITGVGFAAEIDDLVADALFGEAQTR